MEPIDNTNSYMIPTDTLEGLTTDWLYFKPTITDNYSFNYIFDRLSKFLQDLKTNAKNDKAPLIDNFFKVFNSELSNNKFTFFIPQFIENFKIDSNTTIGKVKFIPYSEKNYKELFIKIGGKGISFNLKKDVLKKIFCIAVSEASAGDFNKALEKSDKLIDLSLNVIRLFESYPNFGILGKYDRPRLHKVYYYNKSTNQFGYSGGWKHLTRSGRFTSQMFKTASNKYGLNNVDSILQKDSIHRTDMEKKLILSINWYGEILKNRNTIENIVRLFTAFETLLIFEINEEKKKNVSERLVMINYSDKESRLSTYSFVVKLYNARSKLVHEGKTTFKELDFFRLLKELHSCIINIARHIDKYPTIESWDNLLKSVKFDEKLEFQ